MVSAGWSRVPVGPGSARWRSGSAERTVLGVVHNVTALTRLLDVLSVLDSDPRVQTVFALPGSSPFTHDVQGFLADLGALVIPWEQACALRFDLAISASLGGLEDLRSPIMAVSHGMGYNKRLTQNTKHKTQNTGHGPVLEPSFGLSPEWLLHEGRPLPARLVLSHPEQLDRLARDCPPAVPSAVVAGDPCFDRMLASLPDREDHRAALGVPDGVRLILVSSTWGPNSLLARHPSLITRLTAELPSDSYRIAAALHPNIWHGHGPFQVRAWMSRALRAGLLLLPPRDGWRAALVAADLVVGDHGSVTFYAAALSRPVLFATFPHDDVDPTSPVAALGRTAPHLDPGAPLLPQLTTPPAERYAAITSRTTSAPGAAARLLRQEIHALLDLPEPPFPPVVARLPPPLTATVPVTAHLVAVRLDKTDAEITRHPAATALDLLDTPAHLSVEDTEPEQRLMELADVIYRRHTRPAPPGWPAATLAGHPGCQAAALEHAPNAGTVHLRDGTILSCTGDIALTVSAIHAWLSTNPTSPLPPTLTLKSGPTSHPATFSNPGDHPPSGDLGT